MVILSVVMRIINDSNNSSCGGDCRSSSSVLPFFSTSVLDPICENEIFSSIVVVQLYLCVCWFKF